MKTKPHLKDRMIELVKETAEFYNSSNRAVSNTTQSCLYKNSKDNCCAIGRYLEDEHFKAMIGKEYCGNPLIGAPVGALFDFFKEANVDLPEKLKGIPEFFLIKLQHFHDVSGYWNEEGVSESGEFYKDSLDSNIKKGYFDTPKT